MNKNKKILFIFIIFIEIFILFSIFQKINTTNDNKINLDIEKNKQISKYIFSNDYLMNNKINLKELSLVLNNKYLEQIKILYRNNVINLKDSGIYLNLFLVNIDKEDGVLEKYNNNIYRFIPKDNIKDKLKLKIKYMKKKSMTFENNDKIVKLKKSEKIVVNKNIVDLIYLNKEIKNIIVKQKIFYKNDVFFEIEYKYNNMILLKEKEEIYKYIIIFFFIKIIYLLFILFNRNKQLKRKENTNEEENEKIEINKEIKKYIENKDIDYEIQNSYLYIKKEKNKEIIDFKIYNINILENYKYIDNYLLEIIYIDFIKRIKNQTYNKNIYIPIYLELISSKKIILDINDILEEKEFNVILIGKKLKEKEKKMLKVKLPFILEMIEYEKNN